MTVEHNEDVDIGIGLLKSLLTNADEYPIPRGQQESANEDGGHSDPVFYSSVNRAYYWYAPAHSLTQKQKQSFADRLEGLACRFLERAVLFRRDVPSDLPAQAPDSDTARVDRVLQRVKESILLRLATRRARNTT